MKWILQLVCLLATLPSFAQKDFEGRIIYKFKSKIFDEIGEGNHTRIIKNSSDTITAHFAPGKILITSNEGYEKERKFLILLDSAKAYTLDIDKKTYSVKDLVKTGVKQAERETIAGYTTIPYYNTGLSEKHQGLYVTNWYADDLYFKVPQELEVNQDISIVKGNRILLKTVCDVNKDYLSQVDFEVDESLPDSVYQDYIVLTAVSVIHEKQDPSRFIIPNDYVQVIDSDIDETAAIMDSIFTTESIPGNISIDFETGETTTLPPSPAPPVKKKKNKTPVRKED